jgi:hypothetical protein
MDLFVLPHPNFLRNYFDSASTLPSTQAFSPYHSDEVSLPKAPAASHMHSTALPILDLAIVNMTFSFLKLLSWFNSFQHPDLSRFCSSVFSMGSLYHLLQCRPSLYSLPGHFDHTHSLRNHLMCANDRHVLSSISTSVLVLNATFSTIEQFSHSVLLCPMLNSPDTCSSFLS